MIRSIVRYAQINDVSKLIEAIESVTRGKVVEVREMFGQAYLTIEHHDGPVCPHCGKEIHPYGHGLCHSCWIVKSKELRGL